MEQNLKKKLRENDTGKTSNEVFQTLWFEKVREKSNLLIDVFFSIAGEPNGSLISLKVLGILHFFGHVFQIWYNLFKIDPHNSKTKKEKIICEQLKELELSK